MDPLYDKKANFVGWLVEHSNVFDKDLKWVAYAYYNYIWATKTRIWIGELRGTNLLDRDGRIVAWSTSGPVVGSLGFVVVGKTIAGQLTNKKLKEVATWQWSDDDMKSRLETGKDIEMCDKCIKLEYSNRQDIKVTSANIEFSGSLKIDLGGIYCEITEIEAPHSEDSLLIYVPEEKVVFIGDADCEDHYDNNGQYDKDKLGCFIELIKEIDFNTYVLGHDKPETKEEAISYLMEELKKLS
ncbi:4-fold beta flower protein [Clostridium sp. UBA4395]|uniref:4-fold beta flower protein n=1 Tax=Clostridium sp. UBA4395 TaxID=1946360 RepID=UPI003217A6A4